MRIPELYTGNRPVFSFEFFPPKTDAGYRSLFRTIEDLTPLEPGFVSVTCGAAGSTREKTADLVYRIQQETRLTAMAHVTCTGRSAEEVAESLEKMERAGIENLLALREGFEDTQFSCYVAAADFTNRQIAAAARVEAHL